MNSIQFGTLNRTQPSAHLASLTPEKQATKRSDETFERLRQAIVTGELRPNERVAESGIAKRLGISRTPVREAFKQLEAKGYLSRLPTGGWVVIDHSPNQIKSLYEIREALETMAIRLACQRATPEQIDKAEEYHIQSLQASAARDVDRFIELNNRFHGELLHSCGNEQLWSLICTFRDQYFDRRIVRTLTGRDWRVQITQHARILEAVREGNARRAEKAVYQHLRTSERLALERL